MKTNLIILTVGLLAAFITSCNSNKNKVQKELFNESAAISGKIGAMDAATILSWHMVTLLKDTKSKEISVLYANDEAFKNVLSRGDHYPAGAKLALVTWFEKPDIHWFGAMIPGEIATIDQITIQQANNGQLVPQYESYINSEQGLKPAVATDALLAKKNTNFILGLRRPYLPD